MTKHRYKSRIILEEFADKLGGYFTKSRRNVPYAVIPFRGLRASVCYFGKSDTYRFFFPYIPFATDNQQIKITFKTLREVVDFIHITGEVN